MNKYTIKDFNKEFRTENQCLTFLFNQRYSNLTKCPKCSTETKFYLVEEHKRFNGSCGHSIFPTKDTIFYNSPTPLTLWFHAIYLFSVSKNGVSAKELERQLGVTYKTAWRIANKIRSLMKSTPTNKPSGNSEIEIDETYLGGKEIFKHKNKKTLNTQGRSTLTKTPILGSFNRTTGEVNAIVVENVRHNTLKEYVVKNANQNDSIMTDEFRGYKSLGNMGYSHSKVKHGKGEFVKGSNHTNSIEGFWSVLKRGLRGTYIHVSDKYLQNYIDEFTFRFNNRNGFLMKNILNCLSSI